MICIDQSLAVLDEASIKFTENLYANLFKHEKICTAFEKAKRAAQLALGEKGETEVAKRFKLVKRDEHDEFQCWAAFPRDFPQKAYECTSPHILAKKIPKYNEVQAKYRHIERQKIIQELCSGEQTRLIQVLGLFGDGKEMIAKSCMKFVAERKLFCGGAISLNLQQVRTCEDFINQLF